VEFHIGISSVQEIDKMNILQSSLLAMTRALNPFFNYNKSNLLIIIDGNAKPNLKNITCKNIIKGDQKSISIAAASVIAKIHRDKIMKTLSIEFPLYDWENNMGYGTKKHSQGLRYNGITRHHRKSFKPIKTFIQKNY